MNPLKHFELFFWISALIALALTNPENHHYSICPISNLGFEWCPGCGLGRSIACILNGDFYSSLKFHWFGFPALAVLLHRIVELLKKYLVYFTNQTQKT